MVNIGLHLHSKTIAAGKRPHLSKTAGRSLIRESAAPFGSDARFQGLPYDFTVIAAGLGALAEIVTSRQPYDMKNILVIGAGRSSSALIRYLLEHAAAGNWSLRVGDMSAELAEQKINGHPNGAAFRFDINDTAQREKEIQSADLVVSMLPATMHGQVAKDCVRFGRHLVTASYVSGEMRALDEAAKQKGVLLLNEIGLDPGIDHMSAMQVIDRVKGQGGTMTAFYSYCGGLVAPESNDNPWGYKFSWNPRNVILAGQGAAAQYIENGRYKYLPYTRLFAEARTIHVNGWGDFDAYANRDSLSYRAVYGLENISTMLRGTLRMPGYCKAWNVLVQLGMTDESYQVKDSGSMTYAQFTEAFLPEGKGSPEQRLAAFGDAEAIAKIKWTGLLDDEKIPLKEAAPAQILQELLERKWKLQPQDKDMIVMQHRFEYTLGGKQHHLLSSLVVKGEDQVFTAMAKTVGLPAAIAVRLILEGKLSLRGVQVPVMKEIYEPVLQELEGFGIRFEETETEG